MKTMLSIAAALCLVTTAVSHAQAGLTGTWTGETRSGSAVVLDITVKGADLTGTLTRNDQRSPITEGKVAKTTFTFKSTINDQVIAFSGELAGDDIKIWMVQQGPSAAIVLKRVKK